MYTMICSVAAVVYLQFVLHVMLSHMWNMFSVIIIIIAITVIIIIPPPPPLVQLPLMGQGLLIIKASRSHLDMLHYVGFCWMSDQLNAETPTWQHTTITRDRCPCPEWDLNLKSVHHTLDHMATEIFFKLNLDKYIISLRSKLWKVTVSFIVPISLSTWNGLAPPEWLFMKFDISGCF